jgi:hypothetical protein
MHTFTQGVAMPNARAQQPTGGFEAAKVKDRIRTWLAYGVWAMGTLFLVAALVLMRLGSNRTDTAYQVVLVLIYLALSLGAWVAVRRPANPTGWLLCGPPFGILGSQAITLYVDAALPPEPVALPVVRWAAWVGNWIFVPIVATGPWLLLLFPNGQLPSRRWRPYAGFLLVLSGLLLVTAALQPGPTGMADAIINPLGIALVGDLSDGLSAIMLATLPVSAIALLMRFRHSQGEERQQIKIVVYAGSVLAVVAVVGQVVFWYWLHQGDTGATLFAFGMPPAIAAAILRYRLYDIDRLINRTLVYGLLTVLLGAIYAGGVFSLGRLLNPFTGESSLAVAAATLAVAALFQPARRRIQAVVDRRFNRRRYDAAKTIEAFTGRLREQVELDTLSSELLAVVDQTLEPTRASLWLRPSAEASGHSRG